MLFGLAEGKSNSHILSRIKHGFLLCVKEKSAGSFENRQQSSTFLTYNRSTDVCYKIL